MGISAAAHMCHERDEEIISQLRAEVDRLRKCEAAMTELQARVRELEKVIQDGLCDESTEPFCEWCISARNALREEQKDE